MEVRCAPRDGILIRTRRIAGKKTTSYNMSRGRATRQEMNTVAQNSRTNPEAPRKTKPVRMDQPIQNAKRYQKKIPIHNRVGNSSRVGRGTADGA